MLDQTIQEVLEKGRVGTLVFVRWVAYVTPGCLKESLASMLVVTQSWLRTKPRRLYVQDGRDAALINASVLYASGQTALVTAAAVPGSQSSYGDLMLLGNRGAIYHDGNPLWRLAVTSTAVDPLAARLLLDAIERSLNRHQPVDYDEVS